MEMWVLADNTASTGANLCHFYIQREILDELGIGKHWLNYLWAGKRRKLKHWSRVCS